jgi:hypothetical protein
MAPEESQSLCVVGVCVDCTCGGRFCERGDDSDGFGIFWNQAEFFCKNWHPPRLACSPPGPKCNHSIHEMMQEYGTLCRGRGDEGDRCLRSFFNRIMRQLGDALANARERTPTHAIGYCRIFSLHH